MLSQIVRPMVRTQIRLLASSQATRSTLIRTIAQWLGFLGVQSQVTRLEGSDDRIHVSITVGKPDACDRGDWDQILQNLRDEPAASCRLPLTPDTMTSQQQSKLQRLLAYVIQIADFEQPLDWDALYPQLQAIGLEESILPGIRSALKVPQSLEQLMEGLDADVAAIALTKAVSISLLNQQINPSEDRTLAMLLKAMKR